MSARRGRKKKFKLKFNIRGETVRSIAALLLILLAGVVLVSFAAGVVSVDSSIQRVLKILFGYAHLALVPIFLITGLLLIDSIDWRFVEGRVLAGFSILLFGASGLLHAFYLGDGYEAAKAGKGGGIVGYKIFSVLSSNTSSLGAILVLLTLVIISILLIWDKPIEELAAKLSALGLPFSKLKAAGLERKSKNASTHQKEDIHITSGLNLNFSDNTGYNESIESSPEEDATNYHDEDSAAEEIEIIPSLAEPKSKNSHEFKTNPKVTDTLAPAPLPYSDRVWENPPLDILNDPPNTPVDRGDINQRSAIIVNALASFGINVVVKDVRFGPSVTQYALETEPGTKITKILSHQYDLALALASPTGSVRIEAPIPGKSLIGVEVPNNTRVVVHFKELLLSEQMKNMKSKIGMVLGLDVGGQPKVYNIAKMPHLLIAGATNSGKSVLIHNIMFSILFRASPEEVKFILIDPKRVELMYYNDIPHLLTPVITETEKAPAAFKWLVGEMTRRYNLLESAHVRNIESYNEKSGFQAMPYIVMIVDELGEIMVTDPAAVEKSIIRLAQLARATGIHLVLALQRPSANVVTGLIKANVPCRIAFNVTSQVDSRVIIDQPGAEKLLGKGDMLFIPPDDSKPTRIQGSYIADNEINALVSYLKSTGVKPDYKEEILSTHEPEKSVSLGGDNVDEYYDEAMRTVISEGRASASLLQRRLQIGYSRAARILDELEANGVIGPARGAKPREILNNSIADLEDEEDVI